MRYDGIRAEFEYSTGVWTDEISYTVSIAAGFQGITGWGPLDRVAATGSYRFILRNDNNLFTPEHDDARSGFEEGVNFRLVNEHDGLEATRFYGTVENIRVFEDNGQWYSEVLIYDYINKATGHELQRPSVVENKTIDEVIPLIINNIDKAPLSTDYKAGQDTFTTVFDTVRDRTKAIQEIAKVVNSELGYFYVHPDGSSDEVLTVEGRYERSGQQITEVPILEDINLELEDGTELLLEDGTELLLDSITKDVDFTDGITSYELSHGEHYYNEVKTIVYPREVDAAATSILFDLDRYIQIGAGATKTITGRYRDPNQEAVSVSGKDMVTPVATTDYLMNTASDGSGSDITADLDVTASYGANGVEYELTNNNASTGYITKLQARGKGVYVYRPVEYSAEYSTGISADGRRTLNIAMPYQDNPLAGESFAEVLLDIYATKRLVLTAVEYIPNKSADLMSAFMFLNVGDRIPIEISEKGISSEFVIQSINFTLSPGGFYWCRYGLIPESILPASDFWRLGEAGYSELGETTKLGF